MFHVLSCFDLAEGVTLAAFKTSLEGLDEQLKTQELVLKTGQVGQRVRHPVMDTDQHHDQAHYFVMTFLDRLQCDRSVEQVKDKESPLFSVHRAVWTKVRNASFLCWEDDEPLA